MPNPKPTRRLRRRSQKTGLLPGTLVHVGEESSTPVKITLLEYGEAFHREREVTTLEEIMPLSPEAAVTWVNLDGVHQVEVVEKLGTAFGLHPLLLEDVVNTSQRPKAEDFGQYLYVVLRMLIPDAGDNGFASEQVSIVWGDRWVITFQEAQTGDVFDSIRQRIRENKGPIRTLRPDYLAYSLIDMIVDIYFVIVEKVGDAVEALEDQMVEASDRSAIRRLHRLRRQLITLRRSIWPVREAISFVQRCGSALVQPTTLLHLRDVYDHTIQVVDTLETYRDFLAGMLELHLTTVSYRLNEVMKVLTIIGTIFIPLTWVVGIYGMNFDYMPELRWRWGYPAIMAAMAAVAGGMLWYFRRKRWL